MAHTIVWIPDGEILTGPNGSPYRANQTGYVVVPDEHVDHLKAHGAKVVEHISDPKPTKAETERRKAEDAAEKEAAEEHQLRIKAELAKKHQLLHPKKDS